MVRTGAKTGKTESDYAYLTDSEPPHFWPNRVYYLTPKLSQEELLYLDEQVQADALPAEVQLPGLPEQKSNISRLCKLGWKNRGEFPAMSVTRDTYRCEPYLAQWIQEVRTPDELHTWVTLVSAGFMGLPVSTVERTRPFYDHLFAQGTDFRFLYNALDGRPCSTTLLYLTPPVAGIYLVYTEASCRRQGLATALLRHALETSFSANCDTVILQAMPMGVPVYERLGFDEDFRYILLRRAL
jgi:GNAT superfamily N-acetyltransferase